MADVEALKALVDQLVRDNVAARENAKIEHEESQQTIKDLLTELTAQRAAHVGAALPDAGG